MGLDGKAHPEHVTEHLGDARLHFSRVFRTHVGVPPSDYRRAASGLPA